MKSFLIFNGAPLESENGEIDGHMKETVRCAGSLLKIDLT